MAQQNSNKIEPLFQFNLIPPKTVKEILVIEKRDNSILYSFGLVFFAFFIFFCLTMIQFILIEPKINTLEQRSKERDDSIASFSDEKKINGELFVKAKSLSVILEKDIEFISLLEKTESISSAVPSSKVVSYERELSGEFIITIIVSDFSDIKSLAEKARETPEVKNIYIRRVGLDSDNNVEATLSFEIKSDDQSNL